MQLKPRSTPHEKKTEDKSPHTMTENELRAEAERIRALFKSGEATSRDAHRVKEVLKYLAEIEMGKALAGEGSA